MKNLLLTLILLMPTKLLAEQFVCHAMGVKVPQIAVSTRVLAEMGVAGGVAITPNGRPVTLYDGMMRTYPEEFLNQILAHECSHHQLGHVFLPPNLPTKETTADCRSMFLLQEQLNYGEKQFTIIFDVINNQEGSDRTQRLQACNSMEDYHERNQITRR